MALTFDNCISRMGKSAKGREVGKRIDAGNNADNEIEICTGKGKVRPQKPETLVAIN